MAHHAPHQYGARSLNAWSNVDVNMLDALPVPAFMAVLDEAWGGCLDAPDRMPAGYMRRAVEPSSVLTSYDPHIYRAD